MLTSPKNYIHVEDALYHPKTVLKCFYKPEIAPEVISYSIIPTLNHHVYPMPSTTPDCQEGGLPSSGNPQAGHQSHAIRIPLVGQDEPRHRPPPRQPPPRQPPPQQQQQQPPPPAGLKLSFLSRSHLLRFVLPTMPPGRGRGRGRPTRRGATRAAARPFPGRSHLICCRRLPLHHLSLGCGSYWFHLGSSSGTTHDPNRAYCSYRYTASQATTFTCFRSYPQEICGQDPVRRIYRYEGAPPGQCLPPCPAGGAPGANPHPDSGGAHPRLREVSSLPIWYYCFFLQRSCTMYIYGKFSVEFRFDVFKVERLFYFSYSSGADCVRGGIWRLQTAREIL